MEKKAKSVSLLFVKGNKLPCSPLQDRKLIFIYYTGAPHRVHTHGVHTHGVHTHGIHTHRVHTHRVHTHGIHTQRVHTYGAKSVLLKGKKTENPILVACCAGVYSTFGALKIQVRPSQ